MDSLFLLPIIPAEAPPLIVVSILILMDSLFLQAPDIMNAGQPASLNPYFNGFTILTVPKSVNKVWILCKSQSLF